MTENSNTLENYLYFLTIPLPALKEKKYLKIYSDKATQLRDELLENKDFVFDVCSFRKARKIDCKLINNLLLAIRNHPHQKKLNKDNTLNETQDLILEKYGKIDGPTKLGKQLLQERLNMPAIKGNPALEKDYNRQIQKFCNYVKKRLSLNDLPAIISCFNLSSAWMYPLIEYILTNSMPKPNFYPRIVFKNAPHKEDRKLWVEIKGTTKELDVKKMFRPNKKNRSLADWVPSVKPFQKYLPDYKIRDRRSRPSLERDKFIYDLYKRVGKGRKFYDELKKTKFSDLAAPDNQPTVRKIIERMKRREKSVT